MKCGICEFSCDIQAGESGRCRMMTNQDEKLSERYPQCYSTLFPISIETMPALHFYPNHKFLQIASIGCNFSCTGCVSEILTKGTETLSATLKKIPPEKVVEIAVKENCKGLAFCLNEPTVSFFSFLELSRIAKKNHLLVGFSTNGYFSQQALEQLIPYTDFVNIGFKGVSDQHYKSCGLASSGPVFRNFKRLFEAGIHVEVAAIHMKGFEQDIRWLARFMACFSQKIPFQVMRFIPFGEADMELKPTIQESEALCTELRHHLSHVYLFNSPGTNLLDTLCPACGETIIFREFFGPMGCRIIKILPDGVCSCGVRPDIIGPVSQDRYEESGFFGGYRSTRAYEMLHALLACIGADDPEKVSQLRADLMETHYLKEFHGTVHLPDVDGDISDRDQ